MGGDDTALLTEVEMTEKLVKREAARQFVLEGKTVEKGESIEITPKMEKYLDGLKDSSLVPVAAPKKNAG
jgi:hypothetical protein